MSHISHKVPGVEFSTGSLGHGLPFACGKALAAKRQGKTWRSFVMLSDGELDEGSNWEAILFAPQHRLDNLVAIVDYNKIQSLGSVVEVMELDPLADKFRAFRWSVKEIDGHDHSAIHEALSKIPFEKNKPSCLIAHTVKGKGWILWRISSNGTILHRIRNNFNRLSHKLLQTPAEMRTTFIQELIAQARKNPKIFLVVGDLGYSVIEPFAQEFPERFLNAGVAEQNMTGVAAGLASEGFHVFTYSIANFPTLRCLEQIRNDICYHNFPVTIVSVGAGMAYGNLGYSHHSVQDLAIMRTLPNLTLLSPADPGRQRNAFSG
jgi:transketolase